MDPLFLEINGRRLFCLHISAERERPLGRVLLLPPFAEELNKCRPLLALTARRLAAVGLEVLLPDLHGCGDSGGEFGDARWADWVEDIVALDASCAARAPGTRAAYLAVRSGALLLASARSRLPDFPGSQVVLWQPVLDGRRFLQQFLRLRIMTSRMAGGAESLEGLEQRMRSGEPVEVGGYALHPTLAAALEAASLTAGHLAGAGSVHVLEFKPGAAAVPSQPIQRLVDDLRANGTDAAVRLVACEPFWTTQEISVPDQVAEQSAALLRPRSDERHAGG